eukprot:2611142-Amphidinium_carterae.1
MEKELEAEMAVRPHYSHEERRQKLHRARARFANWSDDGFLLVDTNNPNAFVHAMVPRLIIVERGLFRWDRLTSLDSDAAIAYQQAQGTKLAIGITMPDTATASSARRRGPIR